MRRRSASGTHLTELPDGVLSEDANERIFRGADRPDVPHWCPVPAGPVVVIAGGQTGAGKTAVTAMVKQALGAGSGFRVTEKSSSPCWTRRGFRTGFPYGLTGPEVRFRSCSGTTDSRTAGRDRLSAILQRAQAIALITNRCAECRA
ncbi:zeta toxin family protein [Micromonospora sp. URMC 105]|uniref:zeta toxin family protein n=1 Tax=Micromonospora sp. URMC 105 TaxID=3423413 RepID=UPI003F1D74BB